MDHLIANESLSGSGQHYLVRFNPANCTKYTVIIVSELHSRELRDA